MPKKRRKNIEIRKLILDFLIEKPRAIHEISSQTKLHWTTVRHHLIFLKGLDLVEEVFQHNRLRIFAITEEGKDYLKGLK